MNALLTAIMSFTTTLKGHFTQHISFLDSIRGPKGHVFFNSGDPEVPYTPSPIISFNPIIVNTDAEAQLHLGAEESFETVFNTWSRISHLSDREQPAVAAELNSWALDDTTGRITSTINSASLVGFISPDRHDSYIFEVVLRSTNGDDDSIGVCLAFTEVNGVQHTITAMRTPGGSQTHPNVGGDVGSHRAKLLDVYADIFHPVHRLDLGSTNGGLQWGDGTVNDDRMGSDIGGGGWGNHPDGCLIRVVRDGDDFTVETSNFGDRTIVSSATVTFSLNDDPSLAKFKGPQQYGYVAYSQPAASWETIKKPAVLNQVIVLDESTSYVWEGESWASDVSTQQLIDNTPAGRMYYNQQTQKLFFKFPDGTISRIGGTS